MAGTPEAQDPSISIDLVLGELDRTERESDLIAAIVDDEWGTVFKTIYPSDDSTSEADDTTMACPESPSGIIQDSFREEKFSGPDEYDALLTKRMLEAENEASHR